MNFSNILSEIARLDPEVYERTSERRRVIKNWTRRVSLTALPFALGSLFNKAYGKTTDAITEALQFALTLEYLEREFYLKAILATEVQPPKTQLIPSQSGLELPAIKRIHEHERRHVEFLKATLMGMNQVPLALPKFDFTGGGGTGTGPFTQVFTDYGTFLAVAQMLEDLGVRAYKGQAEVLKPNNEVLTGALRIHSVEARHAAHIRMMRAQTPGPLSDGQTIRPWITRKQSGINSTDVQVAYEGEDNMSQTGIAINDIAGFPISIDQATEAFDEAMSRADVEIIVNSFLVP